MGEEVGKIEFFKCGYVSFFLIADFSLISVPGIFHKAYLVTLSSYRPPIARVARRFMPRLKTSSEVATMAYLRERSKVPVRNKPRAMVHYLSLPRVLCLL
jgi:hypothetical protein